ncbi:hypothetical protein ACQPYK_26140 [Streptosporangium sp. CA-135522]|uniref:hypothetical protein n=1 Tax=Streptosporangium sp. CA-135522 TaxID=3240072 RepID=UPI003D91D112
MAGGPDGVLGAEQAHERSGQFVLLGVLDVGDELDDRVDLGLLRVGGAENLDAHCLLLMVKRCRGADPGVVPSSYR